MEVLGRQAVGLPVVGLDGDEAGCDLLQARGLHQRVRHIDHTVFELTRDVEFGGSVDLAYLRRQVDVDLGVHGLWENEHGAIDLIGDAAHTLGHVLLVLIAGDLGEATARVDLRVEVAEANERRAEDVRVDESHLGVDVQR